MHPELEAFLENAFCSIEPTSAAVGRVVVEPDYDVAPDPQDAAPLANELIALLKAQSPGRSVLASHGGFEAPIPDKYSLLEKYLRSVALHADPVEGSWIEVAPPGNWI